MYYCGAAWVSKGHGAVSLLRVGVIGVEGHGAVSLRRVGVVGVEGHGAVSLHCVGVVGVDGPWDRVAVEVARRRVAVKLHDATWLSKGHGAVSLRRVGVVGVDGPWVCVAVEVARHCVGVEGPRRRVVTPLLSVSKWHNAAWLSKGHGAVSLCRVGVVGVDGPWVCVAVEVAQRCVGVDGPQRHVTVVAPRRRVGVEVPRQVRLHP
ncbi:hypothetical protein EDB89DRAFT_1913736 [Lactarius sanguifluus]|nr:hypothetical protein EDB89DRAFT_1913736 [Lactarius sanguifluus]